MRLADYINANIDLIMVEWETFAKSLPPGSVMDKCELRDHASQLLKAAVDDMNSTQTFAQQTKKSKGEADTNEKGDEVASASKLHAIERATAGFKLNELLAEYRALRASVLRLWGLDRQSYDSVDVKDISRFNESIDQSLVIAAKNFTEQIERAQQTFLAILGHDLRNPVNAIKLGTVVLSQEQDCGEKSAVVVAQMASSADAMERMISDLIQFAGSALGSPPSLVKTKTSLRSICQEVIAEVKAADPDVLIRFDPCGEFFGKWDEARMRQVISNLLNNSVQFGEPDLPIEIKLIEEGSQILLKVINQGIQIPTKELETIFDPLVQGRNENLSIKRKGSLGLGLYIVKEVVTSHGGEVDVESSPQGKTVFSVHLPKGLEQVN